MIFVENDEFYFVKDVLGNCDSEVLRRILEKEWYLILGLMKIIIYYLVEKECLLKIKKLRWWYVLFVKYVRRFFKK